jgi:hypothetical protein
MNRVKRILLLALVLAGGFTFGLFGAGVPAAEAACNTQCCRMPDGSVQCVVCCEKYCPHIICGPY